MTQKEFKKIILPELEKAWQAAKEFSADDLIEIEGLRGAIKYQFQQLDHEPSYKSADELKEYRKEIRERIAELKTKINSIYQQYGWIKIEYPGGYYRMVNARQEIERVMSRVRGLTDSKPQYKKYSIRIENPSAAKVEIFEGIVPIAKEGWFTDGHVLVRGEAPKNAELKYPDKKPAEVDWMLKLEGKPAKLMYFFFDHPDDIGRQYISDRPLPTYFRNGSHKESTDPSVVFESDGRFWCYNQNKYNFIANRYPDIDRYEIIYDAEKYHLGELKFYVGDELVGLMMPYRPTGGDEIFLNDPPLREMAVRAGLIKPKEVLPYSGRRLENQMRLGL